MLQESVRLGHHFSVVHDGEDGVEVFVLRHTSGDSNRDTHAVRLHLRFQAAPDAARFCMQLTPQRVIKDEITI